MANEGAGSELRRGPERYIGQPLRVFGMDASSAAGLFPAVVFPFSMYSWLLVLAILITIFIAGRFRLPSYQIFRYLRVRSGPAIIPPLPEQLFREKRGTRRWPY